MRNSAFLLLLCLTVFPLTGLVNFLSPCHAQVVLANLGKDYVVPANFSSPGQDAIFRTLGETGTWTAYAANARNLDFAAAKMILNSSYRSGNEQGGYSGYGSRTDHGTGSVSHQNLYDDCKHPVGDEIAVHPTGGDNYVIWRWVPDPAYQGQYLDFSGGFDLSNEGWGPPAAGEGDGVDFRIFVDGVSLLPTMNYPDYKNNGGTYAFSKYMNFSLTAQVFDYVDFVFGNGNGNESCDHARFQVQIFDRETQPVLSPNLAGDFGVHPDCRFPGAEGTWSLTSGGSPMDYNDAFGFAGRYQSGSDNTVIKLVAADKTVQVQNKDEFTADWTADRAGLVKFTVSLTDLDGTENTRSTRFGIRENGVLTTGNMMYAHGTQAAGLGYVAEIKAGDSLSAVIAGGENRTSALGVEAIYVEGVILANLGKDYVPASKDDKRAATFDSAGGTWDVYLSQTAGVDASSRLLNSEYPAGQDTPDIGYGSANNRSDTGAISNKKLYGDGQDIKIGNELAIHPGAHNSEAGWDYLVFHWEPKAEERGSLMNLYGYLMNETWDGGTNNWDGVEFFIYADGQLIYDVTGTLGPANRLASTVFDETLAVSEYIDFVFSNGGKGDIYGDEVVFQAWVLGLSNENGNDVPEPATWGMMVFGILGGVFLYRRKTRLLPRR